VPELGAADFLGLLLEHVDEGRADDLALAFRLVDARKLTEKQLRRVHMNERNL